MCNLPISTHSHIGFRGNFRSSSAYQGDSSYRTQTLFGFLPGLNRWSPAVFSCRASLEYWLVLLLTAGKDLRLLVCLFRHRSYVSASCTSVRDQADELPHYRKRHWQGQQDLNLRIEGSKPSVLPLHYTPIFIDACSLGLTGMLELVLRNFTRESLEIYRLALIPPTTVFVFYRRYDFH